MKVGLGQQPHGDPQSMVTAPCLLLGSDQRALTLKAGTPSLLGCAYGAGQGVAALPDGLLWGQPAPPAQHNFLGPRFLWGWWRHLVGTA